MSRMMSSLLLGILMLAAVPVAAHGQEKEEPRPGLLKGTASALGTTLESVGKTVGKTLESAGGTVGKVTAETTKGLSNTVGNTVEFTVETVNDLSQPLTSKPITSALKRTNKLVDDTVDNTLPTAETAVQGVNNTVQTVTSETVNTVHTSVDSVTEALPEIPVVTPVVKEVHSSSKELTGVVQTTVEGTSAVLEGTVGGVSEAVKGTVKGAGGLLEETVDHVVKPLQPSPDIEETAPDAETSVPQVKNPPQAVLETPAGQQEDAPQVGQKTEENKIMPVKPIPATPGESEQERVKAPIQSEKPEEPAVKQEEDANPDKPDSFQNERNDLIPDQAMTEPALFTILEERKVKPNADRTKERRAPDTNKEAQTVPGAPLKSEGKKETPPVVISQPPVQQSGMSINGSKASQWGSSGILLDLFQRIELGKIDWGWVQERSAQLWKPPALRKPPKFAPFFIS